MTRDGFQRWRRVGAWLGQPVPVSWVHRLQIAVGAGLAIFGCGWAGESLGGLGPSPPLLASMGASAVILFAVPHSPMAGAWAVMGGHLVSGLVGVTCARLIADPWTAAAVAVALAILVMHSARCLHPPGGASALVAVLGGESIRALGYGFLLAPLGLNVIVLWLLARLVRRPAPMPKPAAIAEHLTHDPPPLERLGIRGEDIRAALYDLDAFVDASEGELNAIYHLAASRAYRRRFGEQDCASIMSRDLVTVEFGTELEETWALMHTRKVKAIPVIDRGRHVIGIITLTDFFRHARVERFDGLGGKLRRLIRRTPDVTSDKPEVAGQIMTAPVITARADAPIADLAPLLAGRGIHQIPIVDARNKLVGIVTQSDLIAALYRNLTPETSQREATDVPAKRA